MIEQGVDLVVKVRLTGVTTVAEAIESLRSSDGNVTISNSDIHSIRGIVWTIRSGAME